MFCGVSEQTSYARKERNKPSVGASQKPKGEKRELPTKWEANSELKNIDDDGELLQIRKY